MLLVTAESPAVVRKEMLELKKRFGIDSKPLQQPPSELETELTQGLISLQAEFERIKTR